MKRIITNISVILLATILTVSCTENPKPVQQITQNTKLTTQKQIIIPNRNNKIQQNKLSITNNQIGLKLDTTNIRNRKEYLISPNESQLAKYKGVELFIQEGVVRDRKSTRLNSSHL